MCGVPHVLDIDFYIFLLKSVILPTFFPAMEGVRTRVPPLKPPLFALNKFYILRNISITNANFSVHRWSKRN